MRNLFSENDLICAEIHSINNDHTVNLHTRNIKYGKVQTSILIIISYRMGY
jgi:exosome complex component RRP4